MKPVLLTLSGWGPYKETQVIDFRNFNGRNLFLITGQTGAGKTTIFDALTYALYGTLSGDVREKATVRSDFADENTKTYVELIMTHRSLEYKICRNPEYLRPKKRKGGNLDTTKEKENAILTLPDGTIIAGNNDVTNKMREILSMDVHQFKQISMIAQGDFSRMILASPAEKTSIFREIFATGPYALLQSSLKEKSSKLLSEYMLYKNKIEEDIHMLDINQPQWNELTSEKSLNISNIMQFLRKTEESEQTLLKEEEINEKNLSKQILVLHSQKAVAQQINKQFNDYDAALKKFDDLVAGEEDIKQIIYRQKRAEKARKLFYEEKSNLQTETEWKNVIHKIDRLKDELCEFKLKIDNFSHLYNCKESMLQAFDLEDKIKTSENLIKTKKNELDSDLKSYQKIKLEYEKSQDELDDKRKQYENAQSNYRRAVVGIAASMVKEGEPCPVCGSISHPAVAKIQDREINEEYLKKRQIEFQDANERCNDNFAKAVQIRKDCELKEEQIKSEDDKRTKLIETMDGLPVIVKEYMRQNGSEGHKRYQNQITEYQSLIGENKEKEKALEELKKEEKRYQEEVTSNKEKFNKIMIENDFETYNDYQCALQEFKSVENFEKRVSAYKEERAATENMLAHLRRETQDKKVISLGSLQSDLEQIEGKRQILNEQIKKKTIFLEQIRRVLNGIKDKKNQCEKLSEQYGIAKDLDDLANGNNPKRLVFEQYVLAGYFERILKAANLRLRKMTDGRYELKRALQISDGRKKDNLEITVMDFYTGKERSVKTLSGGEIFKASLSLALGMSDCIQAESGGIQIDTLFIDEGFGALDEESLGQACSTLQTLASNNKMIGIISHVQELRERIDNQIIVEKKNVGSSIRVVS